VPKIGLMEPILHHQSQRTLHALLKNQRKLGKRKSPDDLVKTVGNTMPLTYSKARPKSAPINPKQFTHNSRDLHSISFSFINQKEGADGEVGMSLKI